MSKFKQFYAPENLLEAFGLLEIELQSSSLPLAPIWSPGLKIIQNNKEQIIDELSTILKENKYRPDPCEFFLAPKQCLGVRPVAILTVVDRLIYQAILNKDILGRAIFSKLNRCCYIPRLSTNKDEYYYPYKKSWHKFLDDQIAAFEAGYCYHIEFDVKAYFDNISLEFLEQMLTNDLKIKEPKLLPILFRQLKKWAHRPGYGIPQGPSPSNILSNIYLTFIDNIFTETEDVKFFRYQDDMVMMAKDENILRRYVERVVHLLFDKHLSLNDKTKLRLLESADIIEEKKFSQEYGIVKIMDCKQEVPRILDRINSREEIPKKDFSTLKYYLKASSDDDYIAEIINMIPHQPALTDVIAGYLCLYMDVPSVYAQLKDVILNNYMFSWQKFWYYRNLLASRRFYEDSDRGKILLELKMSNFWQLRTLYYYYWYYRSTIYDDVEICLDDIVTMMESPDSIFEKIQYLFLFNHCADDEDSAALNNIIKNQDSLELLLINDSLKDVDATQFKEEYIETVYQNGMRFTVMLSKDEGLNEFYGTNQGKKPKERHKTLADSKILDTHIVLHKDKDAKTKQHFLLLQKAEGNTYEEKISIRPQAYRILDYLYTIRNRDGSASTLGELAGKFTNNKRQTVSNRISEINKICGNHNV